MEINNGTIHHFELRASKAEGRRVCCALAAKPTKRRHDETQRLTLLYLFNSGASHLRHQQTWSGEKRSALIS